MITIASGGRRHVAGGVRRHVAAGRVAARALVLSRGRGHFTHRSDGRVGAVRAGQRADAHQHVGIGRVRGACVARAENTGNKAQSVTLCRQVYGTRAFEPDLTAAAAGCHDPRHGTSINRYRRRRMTAEAPSNGTRRCRRVIEADAGVTRVAQKPKRPRTHRPPLSERRK